MRIGIDARELCGHPTGVGRYLRGLLTTWASTSSASGASRYEFVLYAPEALDVTFDSHRFVTRTVPGPAGTWWEQRRLPAVAAGDRLDVFFGPGYSAPLFDDTPFVVAMHDISFVAHPEWFPVREGARRRWLARQVASKAGAIITISQFSKREIIEHLRVPAGRVHVIPPGVTPPGRRSSGLAPGVLYAGSIFNRRHLPDLIRGFEAVARAHPDAALDIVGDNRTFPHQDLNGIISAHGLAGQARWRQYLSDIDMAALFETARVFAFLSEYEGLGLTPLEALSAGIPPLLLDTAVARESCGDAALYVGKDDVRAITSGLEALLFDPVSRSKLLAAAPDVLARYDWATCAAETLDVLEAASGAR